MRLNVVRRPPLGASAGRWDERGQAIAELALIVSMMIFMAVAVFDVGRGMHAYLAVIQGARDGARVAMDTSRTDDDITAVAQSAAHPLAPSVTIVRTSGRVSVTVSYGYQPMTPLAGMLLGGPTLQMSSTMVSQ